MRRSVRKVRADAVVAFVERADIGRNPDDGGPRGGEGGVVHDHGGDHQLAHLHDEHHDHHEHRQRDDEAQALHGAGFIGVDDASTRPAASERR